MADEPTTAEEQPLPELPFPARRRSGGPAATSYDPMGGIDMGSLPESRAPMEDVERRAEISRRRGGMNVPKFPSLETMYSAYPDLRKVGKLRVQRIEPEWHLDPGTGQRQRVSGIVGMHNMMIGTQEFLRLYGGYKYRVYGVMEQGDSSNMGGPPALVDVAVAEFSVPVDPNMQSLPIADSESSEGPMVFTFPGGGSPYGGAGMRMQMPQQQQPQDYAPFLSFAERMANRPQQAQQGLPDTVFSVMGRQQERAIDSTKEMAQQQVALLERQLEAKQAEMMEMRRQIAEIGQKPNDMVEMVKAVALINSSVRGGANSDDMRAVQEQHAREMEMRQREFERLIEIEKREKEREVERVRSEMQTRVASLEDRMRDKDTIIERRERELKDDFDRRERYLREEHKRSMEEAQRIGQQRLDDIQRSHDRETRMREAVETNTKTTLDAAHGFEVRALQNQLAATVADLQSKAQLVNAHLAEQNKPLLNKVQELRETAVALGIATDEKEGGPTPEEAAMAAAAANAPWYQKAILMAISQADTLIPQIKDLLQKGSPPVQQVQVQQVPPVQQARQMLPPPRRVHRVQFADSEGPAVQSSFDNLPGPQVSADEHNRMSSRSPGMPPVPFNPMTQPSITQQPMRQAPQQPVQQPQYPPPVVIEQAPQGPVTAAQAVAADTPVSQPAAKQNVAPKKEPWSSFDWIPGINREQVAGLVNTIKEACSHRVPPEVLVKTFIEQNGESTVVMIPQVIEKDRFVASLRSDPATSGTVLATGKGKRYLDDVWRVLMKVQAEFIAKQQKEPEAEAAPEEPAKE
ncbi:MAG: hypothetical protein WC683_02240 [bacterium]